MERCLVSLLWADKGLASLRGSINTSQNLDLRYKVIAMTSWNISILNGFGARFMHMEAENAYIPSGQILRAFSSLPFMRKVSTLRHRHPGANLTLRSCKYIRRASILLVRPFNNIDIWKGKGWFRKKGSCLHVFSYIISWLYIAGKAGACILVLIAEAQLLTEWELQTSKIGILASKLIWLTNSRHASWE